MNTLSPLVDILQDLEQKRKDVIFGLRVGDTGKIQTGVHSIAKIIGRCLTEISSSDNNILISQTLRGIFEAQRLVEETTKPSDNYYVDHTTPSSWVSFDGEIKHPLYITKSTIPTAGNGLFCKREIKQGEVIGPNRVQIAESGNFFTDWRKFPIAAMVNHHPIPNMTIVRADPPLGTDPSFGQTCYFVANRDIEAKEELTSDYRDKGWAEWDYYNHLDLPFEQWDRLCLSHVKTKSLPQTIIEDPIAYKNSLGFIAGPAMVYASTKTSGLYSGLLALTGLICTGYAAKDNK